MITSAGRFCPWGPLAINFYLHPRRQSHSALTPAALNDAIHSKPSILRREDYTFSVLAMRALAALSYNARSDLGFDIGWHNQSLAFR